MTRVKNFLFVMCDQLRADYLGCYGHPTIETPHIDALSSRSTRFNRAYCQSPVCGPSRMSFYTGRYMISHGASWNNVPLRVGELTIGDYLRPLGYRVAVVGESHFIPDLEGMKRMGLSPSEGRGILIAQGGFEPWERDDQIHPDGSPDLNFNYNRFLRQHGYQSPNPWHDFANSAEGRNGEILSGWYMRNARLPARVKEEHSETAYFTDRAIEFMKDTGERPWCLHLSYMKPHWPYIAPAPYHNIYNEEDVLPANRSDRELENAHPVFAAFMKHDYCAAFRDESQRRQIAATYMGLVKQLDDHIGRLLRFLEGSGLKENTMIVLTSDHGGYLGDHWLGEKHLFHEESARIPMIIHDPSPAADITRGMEKSHFVESIDLIPTFLDAIGQPPLPHRLEGRSLLPVIRAQEKEWRDTAISEYDYGFMKARVLLGLGPSGARAYMARTERWKYVLFDGFRPQLFDLLNDPHELTDLGAQPGYERVKSELHEKLFSWMRNRAIRTTMSDETVDQRTDSARRNGIIIEIW